MGLYRVLKNGSVDIHIPTDYQDNGWSFVNGTAVHNKLNTGSFSNFIFRPESNKKYSISFTVSSISGGVLKVSLGGVEMPVVTVDGEYNFEIISEGVSPLSFWSDADVVVSKLLISDGVEEAVTIVYDFDNDRFSGEVSYNGDFATLFLDNMITFKNGSLWIHDKNNDRNSYYGVKYPAKFTYYMNANSAVDKDFFTVSLNGNSGAYIDIDIVNSEGKSLGQRSRIKKGNFKLDHGKYVADFLRDMNDPRYPTETIALMRGAELQGKIMKVTVTTESEEDFKLASVEIDFSIK